MTDEPPASIDQNGRISTAERQRRQKAVKFARNNVRLEGFVLPSDVEELNRRYVDGKMTSEEHSTAIRAQYGRSSSLC